METAPKRQKLTALAVATLPPGRHWDGQGLHLIVKAPSPRNPSGQRSWALRVTLAGKKVDLGLGSASAVSLAAARKEAGELRRLVRQGIDPRRQKTDAPTFRAAAKIVFDEVKKTFRNQKHKDWWWQSLKNDAFGVIGDVPVDRIDSADVLRILSPIWLEKPETARRVKQRIKTVMDWAKARGHRTGDNPTEGIETALPRHKASEKAHHPAMHYDEIPGFIKAVQQDGRFSTSVMLALEFLILCASRTSEVIGAQWPEIDIDAKTWTIPASRIKAGKEHKVPLSDRALEILAEAKKIRDEGSDYVFPGRFKRGLSQLALLMVLRRMKRSDVVVHGFRSSFRDWAEERTSTPHAVCEAALAHVERDKVVAAYKRTDLFEKRCALMAAWARHCTTTRPAKVVNIA